MGKVIVTSALPYINGVKHLGNLVGSLLPADVYARYLRMKGEDVLYICGTDEHGTPAEIGAIEEKMSVQDYCDRYFEKQVAIYKGFNLKFDHFGRTSHPSNRETTQHLFTRLHERGLIHERSMRLMYSVDDDRFLPDRFIMGTCPKCKSEKARGDQCDGCGALLDPEDLINPYSAVSGSRNLEVRESKHLFLKLDLMQEQIADWLARKTDWPTTVLGIARKWLQEGLQERCITRDLKWGVPVPLPGYENKVFYVWFDAPIGYISITKDWAAAQGKPDLWEDYWKDPDTKLVQFMGKDNVPFHAVTWPATIMGADDGFILAHYIKGFEWLQYEGGKFSTSFKRGVFSDTALEIFPADYWRFYLMYNAPERSDSNFNWNDFATVIRSVMANKLGNFSQRCLSMLNKRCDGVVPDVYEKRDVDHKVISDLHEAVKEIGAALDELNFSKAARRMERFWDDCNSYIDARAPWKEFKTDPAAATQTLTLCIHLIRSMAILASPFIPTLSQELFRQLGLDDQADAASWDDALDLNALCGRKVTDTPTPIIPQLEEGIIDQCIQRFAGAS